MFQASLFRRKLALTTIINVNHPLVQFLLNECRFPIQPSTCSLILSRCNTQHVYHLESHTAFILSVHLPEWLDQTQRHSFLLLTRSQGSQFPRRRKPETRNTFVRRPPQNRAFITSLSLNDRFPLSAAHTSTWTLTTAWTAWAMTFLRIRANNHLRSSAPTIQMALPCPLSFHQEIILEMASMLDWMRMTQRGGGSLEYASVRVQVDPI